MGYYFLCNAGPNYRYYIKISKWTEQNEKSFYRIKIDTKLRGDVVKFIVIKKS